VVTRSSIKMSIPIKRLLTVSLVVGLTALFCQSAIGQDKNFQSLEAEIQKIVKDTKAVGVSVALINNYEVVWAKGFGVTELETSDSVTSQTLFQAASISKSITALAVMKKVQEGKIFLNDNVNDQLTSWHIRQNNYTISSPVTVKHLLSHTGGVANSHYYIPGYQEADQLPSIVESLNGAKPAQNNPVEVIATPGTQFSYSNCGYWILEALLEDVEKKEFERIAVDEILLPIGMVNSTFATAPSSLQFESISSGHLDKNIPIEGKYYRIRPQSSGGLWSTPTDLAKFLIVIQKSRKGELNDIITKDYAMLMTTPVIGSYGLGFSTEVRGTGVRFFGHDGHNVGYICSMIGSLDKGFGVVIMTNSENGWKAVNKIKKLVGRKFWGF
jgi:CubicO group peptidase (beta-lactamase class C family)